MLWNIYQQGQIHRAQSDATRAEHKAHAVSNDLKQIYARIDSLALTCQAMWEMMRERTTLTDADIEERMQEIDLRDGTADGKMRVPVFECPDCSRKISRRHFRCMYCGAEFKRPHLFE